MEKGEKGELKKDKELMGFSARYWKIEGLSLKKNKKAACQVSMGFFNWTAVMTTTKIPGRSQTLSPLPESRQPLWLLLL